MTRKTDQILARLQRLHPKKIDLSLDRMRDILRKLGNPERKLPPIIHVAGTNGKGSTTACLRAILEAAGLRVHVYSSPHLVRFAERIRLAGKLIDEDYLLDCLLECEKINGDMPITYFEITTAIALRAFAENPGDVLLLEVGLGGRLDATNVIDRPLSTIITPVSMDHQQFLGDDLGGIAREKAGIAKSGVPLIIAGQSPPAKAAILAHAGKVGARPVCRGDWQVTVTASGFDYQDDMGILSLPKPNLRGVHQYDNTGLAIACLRHQDRFDITPAHMAQGITSANWPARLQDITQSIFGRSLPEGSELWLDGGHNPAAGQMLADYFSGQDDRPFYMVCAMMAAKDAGGFLMPFSPFVKKIYGVAIAGEDSHSAHEITGMARQGGMMAEAADSAREAVKNIRQDSGGRAVRVLIAGSLFLAGQILDQNDLLPD